VHDKRAAPRPDREELNVWELYDELIAQVPENSVVSGCLAGLSWFLVRSEGVGVSMRPSKPAH